MVTVIPVVFPILEVRADEGPDVGVVVFELGAVVLSQIPGGYLVEEFQVLLLAVVAPQLLEGLEFRDCVDGQQKQKEDYVFEHAKSKRIMDYGFPTCRSVEQRRGISTEMALSSEG